MQNAHETDAEPCHRCPHGFHAAPAEVTFDVPAAVPGYVVSFAVFVGDDFQTSRQHPQSDPIAVRKGTGF
ncbi:MAG: hypothetical protein FJ276_26650 [Planctomycetes bacterium]|nr:hypothetical protein [Planctomycetota bacterium]